MIPDIETIVALCEESAQAIAAVRGEARIGGDERFPVTPADKASSAILEAGLKKYGFPVISEENDTRVPKRGYAWVVDPLDGTSDFVSGDPDWCIMVGLVEDGAPILGVVYAPDSEMLWTATKGKGSFLRHAGVTKQLTVSTVAQPKDATMLMSRNHLSNEMIAVAERLGIATRGVGSMGIKVGLIASGDADCCWSNAPLGEWDVCAPSIILTEAGGMTSDIFGKPLVYGDASRHIQSGYVASNGHLHRPLIDVYPRISL